DAATFKLLFRKTEYPCATFIAHLQNSVYEALSETGFYLPTRMRIYRDNPFQEAAVVGDEDTATYHVRTRIMALDNARPVIDADREAEYPFYVLVSKLEKRQPALSFAARPSTVAQGPVLADVQATIERGK